MEPKMDKAQILRDADKKLKKNATKLVAFAQTRKDFQGRYYKGFGEYLYEEFKHKKAREIIDDMSSEGLRVLHISSIWRIVGQLVELIDGPGLRKKTDRICWTDNCVGVIPEGNHAYCRSCHNQHKEISAIHEF